MDPTPNTLRTRTGKLFKRREDLAPLGAGGWEGSGSLLLAGAWALQVRGGLPGQARVTFLTETVCSPSAPPGSWGPEFICNSPLSFSAKAAKPWFGP